MVWCAHEQPCERDPNLDESKKPLMITKANQNVSELRGSNYDANVNFSTQ